LSEIEVGLAGLQRLVTPCLSKRKESDEPAAVGLRRERTARLYPERPASCELIYAVYDAKGAGTGFIGLKQASSGLRIGLVDVGDQALMVRKASLSREGRAIFG
jgi:hypothetical protein